MHQRASSHRGLQTAMFLYAPMQQISRHFVRQIPESGNGYLKLPAFVKIRRTHAPAPALSKTDRAPTWCTPCGRRSAAKILPQSAPARRLPSKVTAAEQRARSTHEKVVGETCTIHPDSNDHNWFEISYTSPSARDAPCQLLSWSDIDTLSK